VLHYTRQDIRQHSRTYKGCEAGCSIFCVYRASQVDNAPLRLSRTMCEVLLGALLYRARRSLPLAHKAPSSLKQQAPG
jgi:hypothetical protein